MRSEEYLTDLFTFLNRSPTAFHAVAECAARLGGRGFHRLFESDCWRDLAPGDYFVTRGDASLIAFTLTARPHGGLHLRMAGAHTDSPGLKIKPNPIEVRHGCVQLGVEVYGGALLAPWFDRDLSLAGRVSWCLENGSLHCSLIDFQEPVACIPSLAIHLDREVNSKRTIDKQTDLVPLCMLSPEGKAPAFRELIHTQLVRQTPEARDARILDCDLYLYDTQPPVRLGIDGAMIAGPRLDNLLSCHALLTALFESGQRRDCLIALHDHEEAGSLSAVGAQGPFLRHILERLFPEAEQRQRVIGQSLFLSADNAHAVHPNFAGRHDPAHLPQMNQGPVIKINANQRYATTGLTAALFRRFCEQAGVPCQEFVMRNDLACGSTIGPLTAAEIGVPTVDVGVPQLAMHSVRELAGSLDGWYLTRATAAFFAADDAAIRCPEVR